MRILLTLTCCVGLALSAGAAPQNNNNQNPQYKKKGGNAQQQTVTPQTGQKFKATGTGSGQYNPNKFKYQNQSTINNGGSAKFNEQMAAKFGQFGSPAGSPKPS